MRIYYLYRLLGIHGQESLSYHEVTQLNSCFDYIEKCDSPIFSIDCPAGIHCETGVLVNARYRLTPTFTVCMGLPLSGLLSTQVTGALFMCDTGLPGWIYSKIGLKWPQLPEPYEDKRFITIDYHYENEIDEESDE